ncbi:cytochrome P450 [Cristinia sonorae]|uniref:Cytochrome P450 n=1 Tax=Cristinia sonorae TaxID=1940300 RepID=A0A8K0UIM3_9AGAR|nr:cytochrome P450 [Cristinia sonorae]
MGHDVDAGTTVLLFGPLAVLSLVLLKRALFPDRLSFPDIPALGPTAPLLYYYGAIKFLIYGEDTIAEGYRKYKGGAFKVPELFSWHVIASGREMIEELRKAGDDELNFDEATAELLQTDYTFGKSIRTHPYHISAVRSRLTRNLGAIFDEIRDEIVAGFEDVLPPSDDWHKLSLNEGIMQLICRTSNRIFVGLPTCRHPDYIKLNIDFAASVVISATILRFFPILVRPLVAKILSNVQGIINRGEQFLGAMVSKRLQMHYEYGKDWPDKPNDLVSWLIDEVVDSGQRPEMHDIVLRVLTLNFASIHTTSMSLIHAFQHAAACPEHADTMRKEAEQAVREFGWTKDALDNMPLMDSFLRESHRYNGLGSVTMSRMAMKDFTFSNGTFIPKGGLVSVVERPMHLDSEHYEHPDEFRPWRFVESRNSDVSLGEVGVRVSRYGVVSTSPEYVTFGHGRHACPGRFFATCELKGMLAHLLLNYDIKMENEGAIPKNLWLGVRMLPNPTSEIMYKRRHCSLS